MNILLYNDCKWRGRHEDKRLIKVVTGVRRCGKSTLFELYQDYLLTHGVEAAQIISVNLEAGEFADIADDRALYDYVNVRLDGGRMNYIFLDEVQRVEEFQKAVDALYIKKNCDVYISGSNAHLLSGELATLLSGRYVEIKMLPLSFKEYAAARGENVAPERLYQDYIHNSSFPYALELNRPKDVRQYLDGIYNTIIVKDIITRKRINDVEMLKSTARFMFDNIGNITSTKKIADTMTSAGRKISVHTVENYLDALTESFIFYKIGRYAPPTSGCATPCSARKWPTPGIYWRTSCALSCCAGGTRSTSARSEPRRLIL